MSVRFTENNINNAYGLCRLNQNNSKINNDNLLLTTSDTYFNSQKIFLISNLNNNDILNFQNSNLVNIQSNNIQNVNNITSTKNFYITANLAISTANVDANVYSEVLISDKFSDITTTNFLITLNNDSTFNGMIIKIKKCNSNNKFYIVSGNISNTLTKTKIDNVVTSSTTLPINSPDCYQLISNGVDWFIV